MPAGISADIRHGPGIHRAGAGLWHVGGGRVPGDRLPSRLPLRHHVGPRADPDPAVVEVRIGDDRPVEQPRHDDQVSRARDRRELGHALRDAEDDRLQDGQVVSFGERRTEARSSYPRSPRLPGAPQTASSGAIVTVI